MQLSLLSAVIGAGFLASASTSVATEQVNLNCQIGPVEKTYGSTQWQVYSCDDHKSLIFVAKSGSPASPFYFISTPYGLHGEGTGDKKATDAAYTEINQINDVQKSDLIKETLGTKPSN